MSPRKVYRRVATFSSTDVYGRVTGEWFRLADKSTDSVADQINRWAELNGYEVVFVSPPEVRLAAEEDDKRTYYTHISVLYVPAELIVDGQDRSEEVSTSKATDPQEVLRQLTGQVAGPDIRVLAGVPGLDPSRLPSVGGGTRQLRVPPTKDPRAS